MCEDSVNDQLKTGVKEVKEDVLCVIEILEEARSGTSPKSKNTLINDALKILKG